MVVFVDCDSEVEEKVGVGIGGALGGVGELCFPLKIDMGSKVETLTLYSKVTHPIKLTEGNLHIGHRPCKIVELVDQLLFGHNPP